MDEFEKKRLRKRKQDEQDLLDGSSNIASSSTASVIANKSTRGLRIQRYMEKPKKILLLYINQVL